jgi:DNA polymerase-3 subunit beta
MELSIPEFIVPKKELLRLVSRCHGVADKKAAMPVLANVLLTVEGNALRVAATDLYLAVSGQMNVDVQKPGSVALPAKDLLERIKAMPEGPVQLLTTDGSQAVLKAVGAARRYTLHGMPGGDFPQLPRVAKDAPTLELPVATLSRLIAKTYFSISTDETRAHVNSALFEWSGDRVRMVTTDGHRLSKMEVTVSGAQRQATMLIPLKAVHELRRLADEAQGEDPNATVTISRAARTRSSPSRACSSR